jgi:hypothetical protein
VTTAERIEEEDARELRLAVGSLLDIVSELVVAMEQGIKPEPAFVDLVTDTIRDHKIKLGFTD